MNKAKRTARRYILVSPSDCDPPHGLDMDSARDADKVARLEAAFRAEGFDPAQPALVGYPLNGRIQLCTGTHRHLAAERAGIQLPVLIQMRSTIEAAWGTDEWLHVIADVPVRDLERVAVPDEPDPFPAPPVNMDEFSYRSLT